MCLRQTSSSLSSKIRVRLSSQPFPTVPAGVATDQPCHVGGVTAPRMAMKTATVHVEDQPLAWEAREFVRSQLIGKEVQATILGKQNGRHVCSISFSGSDLAAMLVSQGFAKVSTMSSPSPHNMEDLKLLEETAKQNKLGLWADNISPGRVITWAVGDGKQAWTQPTGRTVIDPAAAVQSFVDRNKGKSLMGHVEFVRDGSCLKVYFIDQHFFCQLLVSGIRCPEFRSQNEGVSEPLAPEAKTYVELRLLSRQINFRIDGCDAYANIYATPLHPRGNIAELLLQEGLARIFETSAKLVAEQANLRTAQRSAQFARKGLWKEAAQALTTEPQPAIVQDAKIVDTTYQARAIEIYSGDCLAVSPSTVKTGARELRTVLEKESRVYLASIRCPRVKTRNREGEPWAVEAFNLLRDMVIGKKITVTIDYTRTLPAGTEGPPPSDDFGRLHFVTVVAGGDQNVNLELVRRGFAKTIRHRVEESRSSVYDELLAAEETAKTEKIGMHSPVDAPKHRINDLVGPENVTKARALESSFKRFTKLRCIVEYVFNAARFIVFIPTENARMTVVLSGIRGPQLARVVRGQATESAAFAEESIAWARFHLLHRTYTLKINACDRGGSYIGEMYPASIVAKDSLNVKVLLAGCARTDEQSLRMCSISAELVAAEKEAVLKRNGMWAISELVAAYEAKDKDSPSTADTLSPADLEGAAVDGDLMILSHVNSIDSFYLQFADNSVINRIQQLCEESGDAREESFPDKFTVQRPPKVGDVCIARYKGDDGWYRAKVTQLGSGNLCVNVFYLDFGNTETLSIDRLIKCPPELNVMMHRPQAHHFSLADIKTIPDTERAAAGALDEFAGTKDLRIRIRGPSSSTGAIPVILELQGEGETINGKIVALGLAKVNRTRGLTVDSMLEHHEKEAKSTRAGMWFYGDVGDSGDDDDDMPILKR